MVWVGMGWDGWERIGRDFGLPYYAVVDGFVYFLLGSFIRQGGTLGYGINGTGKSKMEHGISRYIRDVGFTLSTHITTHYGAIVVSTQKDRKWKAYMLNAREKRCCIGECECAGV